jgi:hypothetical protein
MSSLAADALFQEWAGMIDNDKTKLAKTLAECERLKKFMHDLDAQAAAAEQQMADRNNKVRSDDNGK